MCAFITIKARTGDGDPHPDAPEPVVFEGGFTPDLCTCALGWPEKEGETDEDGTRARQILVNALYPFLKAVSWGDIVIQVR